MFHFTNIYIVNNFVYNVVSYVIFLYLCVILIIKKNKMKNYKEMNTKQLLSLNFQYLQNIKHNITILWDGDKLLNMKNEIKKVRTQLEKR
ncbi:MAG: hypothetical protein CML19_12040 [Pusillimonas sp.]|nr:hypothetical protein [Pusillimonas sp.]